MPISLLIYLYPVSLRICHTTHIAADINICTSVKIRVSTSTEKVKPTLKPSLTIHKVLLFVWWDYKEIIY